MKRPAPTPAALILLIAAGLLLWGLIHAAGAYRYNYHPGRPLIVLGATLAFLGFWFLLLLGQSRRRRRQAAESSSRQQPESSGPERPDKDTTSPRS